MRVSVIKSFFDTTIYDHVHLHCLTGDVDVPVQIESSTGWQVFVTFPDKDFVFGMYGDHIFYSNHHVSHVSESIDTTLVEP